MNAPDPAAVADLGSAEPGTVLTEAGQRLRRADLVAYAAASGDHNPIHQDEAFAQGVGLPDVIAHGMLTMGLVASQVEALAAGRRVLSLGTRFASPVVVPEGQQEAPLVEMALTLVSRDESERTATVEAAVTVAGTRVLSRTRAVIQLE